MASKNPQDMMAAIATSMVSTSPFLEEAKAPGQCTNHIIFTSVEQFSPDCRTLIKMAYEQN